jgi:hypothetical protein
MVTSSNSKKSKKQVIAQGLHFRLEKVTKGAVRFQEVDSTGEDVEFANAVVGAIYIRKAALKGVGVDPDDIEGIDVTVYKS